MNILEKQWYHQKIVDTSKLLCTLCKSGTFSTSECKISWKCEQVVQNFCGEIW